MSQEKFDLLFTGELVPGFELSQVKKNIQLLFRIDEAKTDILFSGRAIELKKNLDAETANKYRVAIKKAGARVSVVQSAQASAASQSVAEPNKSAAPPSARPAAASGQSHVTKTASAGSTFATELGAQPVLPRAPRPEFEAPAYDVAAVGADILPADYKLPVVDVEVDTSKFSVAPPEGPLVRQEEYRRPEVKAVSVPEFDVAPAGSDVLTPAERPQVPVANVDTSKFSVAEPGERLGSQSAPAPAPPNVDHIKLEK